VLKFVRPFSAVLALLVLASGSPAVCAGWLPTPEARKACCTGDGHCPMHHSASERPGVKRVVTQAEADTCCASSERDESAPSSAPLALSIVLALAPGPVLFSVPEAGPAIGAWRTLVPLPAAHVPKHVLLSVFLV
jgi:hypothetical protein